MAAAFKLDVPSLERQLVHLIGEGHIQARIDSANKVRCCFFSDRVVLADCCVHRVFVWLSVPAPQILYARHSDQRTATYQQAMNVGTRYVRDVKSLLLRMSLVENNFIVKAPDSRKRRGDDEDEEKSARGPDRP